MGGGSYYRDVDIGARSTRSAVFTHEGYADATAAKIPERRECHQLVNPKSGRGIRECAPCADHPDPTPIVIAMDVTKSRGEDAVTVYDKVPGLIGRLIMGGIVPHPVISFAAVGDASSGDQAPVQSGMFESDARLDEELSKIWLEEGGGGTGQESYELMAYFYARHSNLWCNSQGKKGFFFFLGDEGFYPFVKKDQAKVWLGDTLPADLPSAQAFAELQEKYHVFLIFPRKSWEERKADIDAEIKKRVEGAGGQYSDVDIRASLLWNNTNDLDLHVVDPCGHHIFYGSYCKSNSREPAPCGGFLDVDMNVRGETTKPVENTRWPKGKARPGHYQVYVQNFAFHGSSRVATKFRVEIEINGEIRHFDGETPAGLSGEASNVPIFEFDYAPAARSGLLSTEAAYANYNEKVVIEQWASVIPAEQILMIQDPRAVVDAMIGAMALTSAALDLDGYIRNLNDVVLQTPERQEDVRQALASFARIAAAPKVSIQIPRAAVGGEQVIVRRSRSQRL